MSTKKNQKLFDKNSEQHVIIARPGLRIRFYPQLYLQIDQSFVCDDLMIQRIQPANLNTQLSHRNTEICIFGPDRHSCRLYIDFNYINIVKYTREQGSCVIMPPSPLG